MNNAAAPDEAVDAGPFGRWLQQVRAALHGEAGMQVPCGDCVGCCTSGYSILLRPSDAALEVVPVKFLSGVKGLTYPHVKMNPLENGQCPMFRNGQCSIYTQRPQTCLDYDCRVFAAAGIGTGDNRPVINQRIRAWQFTYEDAQASQAHAAVRAAAAFIQQHNEYFPDGWMQTNPSGIAVLAIKVHELFLDAQCSASEPAITMQRIVACSRAFDTAATRDSPA